ncbi:hypothetical protein BCR44DRAFT_350523 [Catenaria anguillulae PL171]|uniref:Uncharacterized protein n=1 Tax=Catenaria anguillulae PL171 TaxID=765915 RepID=A0A1Y2HC25_9FUNG|nr:hypothetical protein BCR44DRAFT_350523 [Catenaria anguillulae PL171]
MMRQIASAQPALADLGGFDDIVGRYEVGSEAYIQALPFNRQEHRQRTTAWVHALMNRAGLKFDQNPDPKFNPKGTLPKQHEFDPTLEDPRRFVLCVLKLGKQIGAPRHAYSFAVLFQVVAGPPYDAFIAEHAKGMDFWSFAAYIDLNAHLPEQLQQLLQRLSIPRITSVQEFTTSQLGAIVKGVARVVCEMLEEHWESGDATKRFSALLGLTLLGKFGPNIQGRIMQRVVVGLGAAFRGIGRDVDIPVTVVGGLLQDMLLYPPLFVESSSSSAILTASSPAAVRPAP